MKGNANMKAANSLRIGASLLFGSRHANRERPDYLVELIAFAIIVIAVILSLG